MGQSTNGLTNSAYADWLNNTASQDCSDVGQIYVKYDDDSSETITDDVAICDFMEDSNETDVSTFEEVKFSGGGPGGDWYATDKRVTTNLERTVNFGSVPLKIKRPPGG